MVVDERTCKFAKNRECTITSRLCIHSDPYVCEYIHKAYDQGYKEGYNACEADELFEGSGIGGFHDY